MKRVTRPIQLASLGFLGGGLCLVAVSASTACQHSAAVLELENQNRGGGAQVGPLPPDLRPVGKNPTEALRPSDVVVTDPAPPAPVVVVDGRTSCADDPVADLYTTDPAVEQKARELVNQMNVDQKVLQLTGVPDPLARNSGAYEDIQRSRDDPALNLRGYQWRDGPHGLNLEAGKDRDQYMPNGNFSTSFPTSVCQGASFDVELATRVGRAMGDETVAAGMNVLLAPCMNILRHPYWGRAQETFGEDAFHLGRIATGITVGLQEQVTGCAKHWLANNIENDRFYLNADMDEQTLRETYGRHFEMVVRDGGIGCVMASYNSVNGVKATQSKHVLTTVLRNDFGFRGFILTDWWAMPSDSRGQGPTNAPQDEIYAAEALAAGLDVEVPWTLNYDSIPRLLSANRINVSLVDDAVARVLEQKLRFNTAYMNGPLSPKAPVSTYDAATGSVVPPPDHLEIAREAAEKGVVLLKNDNKTLPIPATAKKVAVIGAIVDYRVKTDNPKDKKFNFALDAALGDRGSSRVHANPATSVGPFAGLELHKPADVTVVNGSTADAAADADFVVVVVGYTAADEGEEYTGASDRDSLALPEVHNTLVSQVAALGKPMVVIVEAGGVVDMPWLSSVPAVVMAWYPGQRGGDALGRLLFNKANFSGRLPVTWPRAVSDFPPFVDGEVNTTMDYYVGYKRFDKLNIQPLYAFGHGLSYSTFKYERLSIPCGTVTPQGIINVEVDVRNVEGPAGEEVVMVFASYPNSTARRPVKELKGFGRVYLEPGQAKRITIPIRVQDLNYWDSTKPAGTDGWTVEAGDVLFQVGPSSDRLVPELKQTVTITAAQ
jgi:beta-glucosidase